MPRVGSIRNAAAAHAPLPARGAAVRAILDAVFPGRRLDRVLLVNPPDADAELFRADAARRGVVPNFPPYGLAVLAQHLRALAVEVHLVNLNHAVLKACRAAPPGEPFGFDAVWQRHLDEAIAAFAPQLIGVTCMFTMTHESLRRVCAWAGRGEIPVAIGGVHVTNDLDRVLDEIPAARFAFLRESDAAVQRFVHVVRGAAEPETLAQVVVVDPATGERHGFFDDCHPPPQMLDVVPALELLELETLAEHGIIGSFSCFIPAGTRCATALGTRGCRARCTFCSVRSFNGAGVRLRSVDTVLDELQRLEEEFGVGHFMWLDDDLFKDHARAVALFNGMVRRGLRLTWDASNGVIAASCTEEVVAAAEASGCVALIIGMESGNPSILRQIAKPGTVDTFLRAAEVLRRHERIHSNVYLMLGFPGETIGMIRDTLGVARHMDLDWYRIKPLQPLPSTPIHRTMIERGLISDTDSKAVRYITGAYGTHVDRERADAGADDFARRLEALPDDVIPTRVQIDDWWFYLNYRLNYERVLGERRPGKLRQQRRVLESICDGIAPDNAFALYGLVVVQRRLDGWADPRVLARLRLVESSSPFWHQRLAAFGLHPHDVESN